MRALVLAGGEGSRLRPLTHTNAKQLIPVANVPILFYAFEHFRAAGIREVGVVVGSTEPEIRAAVGDGSRWDMEVTYIPQDAPLGLAHAVKISEDFVRGEPFIMYLGDNVLLEGVTGFVRAFEEHRPNAQIFLAKVPEPERFGVAVLDGDRVVKLVEKPKQHISDLALVGVYLFDDTVLDAVNAIEPSARGELEITDAIQWLIDNGRTVRAQMVTGWWKDTGRPDDLLEANRMLLSQQGDDVQGEVDGESTIVGTAVIAAGARIVRSTLRGPVTIGAGTLVEASVVGPDVALLTDCVVRGSEVTDSVVMEDCVIDGVGTVTGSILGKGVEVRRSGERGSHRIIAGDQGQIELG
ncbi:MAG: glucose-1-phosphate thymidylyltransferase [Actinobacteria bacterium]|nr:glucose-1-phosphate thymidylyltransferase [Actinomycetota bacterium]